MTVYPAAALQDWVVRLFEGVGVPSEHAAITADVLVRTSLRGIDTHGVTRVLDYVEKIRSGEVKAAASPRTTVSGDVLSVDGDGGLGQVVATLAVRKAVELARARAVVTGLIHRSGHLAALGQFVLMAADEGMVAILCQETPPLMAPHGARSAAIGNNPLAFAAPVTKGPPLVFDMATSVVARGNVIAAQRAGPDIPPGWAIGPDGCETTDPAVALKSAMLPIAGHKGIGLAMLVQILAGSLTGSISAGSAAAHGSRSSAGNVGAFLLVINPALLAGREAFDAHVADWMGTYLAAFTDGARYPGQRAAACEDERRTEGIPLQPSMLDVLVQAGALAEVPFDVAAMG